MKKMTQVGLLIISFLFVACSKGNTGPKFEFKSTEKAGVVASIEGMDVTEKELLKGVESEVYDYQKKIYDLKMAQLKKIMIEKYMMADPNKKNLSNDEYMQKYISKAEKVTEKDIEKFIAERKLPKEQINAEVRERIRNYIEVQKKEQNIDSWLGAKTSKTPVQVFMQKPLRPMFDVAIGDAPTTGNADAKATLIVFSDFECPFCAKGFELEKQLKSKYGKKIKIAYKNFPLPFHNHAMKAAEAGLCANEQGVEYFWKMHDAMFSDQSKLDVTQLKMTAKKIGLNEVKFNNCLDSNNMTAKVNAQMEEGKKVGVSSVPAFFVNGQLISGAQDLKEFTDIIDEALK